MKHNFHSINELRSLPKRRPGLTGPRTPSIELRFFGKVNKQGPFSKRLQSRCWSWTGWKCNGYGMISLKQLNAHIGAHRLSWLLLKGDVPEGLHVLHECDNRSCVNPDHLKLGDDKQNAQDVNDHGYRRVGEVLPWAKLTEAQVLQIREQYATQEITQAELARQYGVQDPAISRIVSGKRWQHLKLEIPHNKKHYKPKESRVFSRETIIFIRDYDQKVSMRALARMLNISFNSVRDIRIGKRWAHVR